MMKYSTPNLLSGAALGVCLGAGMMATVAMAAPAAVSSSPPQLQAAYTLYKKGAYPAAIVELDKAKQSAPHKSRGIIEYWLGLCQSKLQRFDLALPHFDAALALSVDAEVDEIHYERGQALFALQKLKPAQAAFLESVKKNFKVGASRYYAGFISQKLDEHDVALREYQAVLKLSTDPEKVKQAALLQMAEVLLTKHRGDSITKRKDQIRAYVIPAFEKAIDYDKESLLAGQAAGRLQELRSEIGEGTGAIKRLKNGVPRALKPWFAKLTQELKYDSNVTSLAEQSLLSVSSNSSGVSKTDLFGQYEFCFNDEWLVAPEADINLAYYSARDKPNAYQNDAVSFTTALKSRLENLVGGKPAATTFDIEFNYLLRDYQKIHELSFYSRYFNVALGERLKLWGSGSTSFTASTRFYENADPGQNAIDPGMAVVQNFKLSDRFNLTETLNADYNRAKSEINDRINYHLISSLSAPGFWKATDLSLTLDLALIDTRLMQSTRGTEKLINPTLLATRTLSAHFLASLAYSYYRNFSEDKVSYDYSRHLLTGGLTYQF